MIGTIIIAVIGGSLTAFCLVGTWACATEARAADRQGDREASAQCRRAFFLGVALSLECGILTCLLAGGPF